MTNGRTVYIETTVVSYLTARATRDPQKAEWQAATKEWWDTQRHHYDLYTSTLTFDEAEKGHREAAKRRRQVLLGLVTLEVTDAVDDLTDALLSANAVPVDSRDDATHIAIAAVHNIDYLLTWNQSHIANPTKRALIRDVCEKQGYRCPEIYKPNEMPGGAHFV